MAVTKETIQGILKKYGRSNLDTGSSEIQIALLTNRILDLTGHFATHKKDKHGVRGLMKAVNQRRKLLNYLKKTDQARYETVIKSLEIRK